MHGNVWEGCWDLFNVAYYKRSPEADPTGPSGGSLRVSRGKCWGFTAWVLPIGVSGP
jgi:formylglycine-generating enzyme required for sulfatase activity